MVIELMGKHAKVSDCADPSLTDNTVYVLHPMHGRPSTHSENELSLEQWEKAIDAVPEKFWPFYTD